MREAVTFIEQGHVKVGIDTVTDPAFYVSRDSEDYVGWVKGSSIRKAVMKHKD